MTQKSALCGKENEAGNSRHQHLGIANIQPDPKDDKYLEAAIAGKADFIVSGDKHLLGIKKFRSVQIITGREFLDWLKING